MHLVKRIIPTVITIITFLFVLFGYLLPEALKFPYRGQQAGLHEILIEWAVIVAAFALFLGIFNLIFRVHGRKVRRFQQGWPHSLVLLLAAGAASIPPILYGASGEPTQQMLAYVIGPLGASLAALMVFTLTLAAFRLLRARPDEKARSFLFILVVAVGLLTSTPLVGMEGISTTIRGWVIDVLGMAGMRGLLLGVALGTTIAAFRVLWPRSKH